MSNIFIRPIEPVEIEEYMKCFDNDNFFYCTKRPTTINMGLRKAIVYDSVLLCFNDEVVGLAKICDKEYGLFTEIQLVYFNEELYTNDVGKEITRKFFKYCTNICNYCATVFIEVYQFHELLLNHCDKLGLKKLGVLRKRIFKYNKYHDILIYCLN